VDVHDTTDRAMAWFASSQKSGVPITLTNVQTEIIPLPNQKEEQYAEGLVNMGSYQVSRGTLPGYSHQLLLLDLPRCCELGASSAGLRFEALPRSLA
jgi:hypothetical protein